MAIRAVLLDFYGTLVHEDDDVIARITRAVSDSSARKSSATDVGRIWWECFQNLCAASAGEEFRSQRDLEHESLVRTLADVGSSLDPVALSEEMFAHWRAPALFDDTKQFLDDLKGLDVWACVVSNIDDGDLAAAIELHHLDLPLRVTSESARAYKPRGELFADALHRLGCTAADVLHIGDSLSSDVAGAQQAGIRSVWVNRRGRSLPQDYRPTWTVSDLASAMQILVSQSSRRTKM